MRGYVDLQVNGFAGVDFNDPDTTIDQIEQACDAIRADGAAGFLATVITAPLEPMLTCIGKLTEAAERRTRVADVLAGIHIEGPFLRGEPGYVGAHPSHAVGPANLDTAKRLIDAGGGLVRLVTLAPERDESHRVIRYLVDRGVKVAAGHCDPSRDELIAAIDAGLSLFTHLGNGCPAQLPRHDNIIQRALSVADRLSISFIADGHHVPSFALANYTAAIGKDRVIIVSDATSAAALGPGKHRLSDQTVHVDENGAAWSADRSHFAGSATSVGQMRRFLQHSMGLDEPTIERWTVDNPRRLIGSWRPLK